MKALSNTRHRYWLALVILLPSWTNGVKTQVKKQCCKSPLSLPMKAKPTARKMYVLYFTRLSHPLEMDGTSEGQRFKQEHRSLRVLDQDLRVHCVRFTERFWPPKRMRIPGFRPHGSLSGLFVRFVQYASLQTGSGRWEAGDAAAPESRRCPGGLWGDSKEDERVKTVSEGRAYSTEKQRDAEWGWEDTPSPPSQGSGRQKGNFVRSSGTEQCCHKSRELHLTPRLTPSLGERNSLGWQRRKREIFPKSAFHAFSVLSNHFAFSLS